MVHKITHEKMLFYGNNIDLTKFVYGNYVKHFHIRIFNRSFAEQLN